MSMCSYSLVRYLGLSGIAEYYGRLCSTANTNSVPNKVGTSEDANTDAIGRSVRCTTS